MVRRTSLDAYNEIKRNGLLSKRRLEVYEIIFENQPITGSQVSTIFKRQSGLNTNSENVRNRITELKEAGVVEECGYTVDPVTNMTVLNFKTTNELPKKLVRKATKREKKDVVLEELRKLYKKDSSGKSTKVAITKIAKLVKEI